MTLQCDHCQERDATLMADDATLWCASCGEPSFQKALVDKEDHSAARWRIEPMRAMLTRPYEEWEHKLLLVNPLYPVWAQRLGLSWPPPIIYPPYDNETDELAI